MVVCRLRRTANHVVVYDSGFSCWLVMVKEVMHMLSEHKTLSISLAVAVAVCLLPVIGFVLYALRPMRVLVSWLMLAAVALMIVMWLVLCIIRTTTAASVAAQEEALRPGRLYANERLVQQEVGYYQVPGQQQSYQQGYEQQPYASYPDDMSSHSYS